MQINWSLAKCPERSDVVWFPERGTTRQEIQQTKAVCRSCSIRHECLVTAYQNDETVGIWGGALAQDIHRFAALAGLDRNEPIEISVGKIQLFIRSSQM
jgi:WhiB family redox-sensing transcriptional regulator